nr:hypothetical protein [Kiritimatiellia bacterium]
TQQNGSTASMIPVTFTGLSAGTHSYQIVRREDGAGFDRFVFSTSSGTITADTASQNVSTSIQANGNVVVGDDYAGYGDQDGQNGSYTDVQLNNENTGATLQGNSWKTFPLSYEVTPTTVLEVTINAPNVGEILGIALDNDSVPMNSRRSFLLGGSDATDPLHESWSWLVNPLYVEATGEDTFVIAVGQLFTGTVNYIGLIAADDATSAANVSFTDIKLYEDTGSSGGNTTAFIDFTTVTQSAYSGSQDAAGSVTILDNGLSLELTGNRWRVIVLPYTITSNSLIDFDITIENEGELIGIGLDDDNSIHTAPSSIFKVAGADASPSNWFDFTTDYYAYEGGTDHIVIPVGKYYTGGSSYLAFVGDDDVGSAADVIFSNVRLYEGVLIDFDDFVLSSYSDQDGFNGHPTTTSVSQGGLTLNLQGNVWKKIPLNYTVTEHTIIECEVTVNPGDTSEVIAIGFEDDDVLSNDLRLFQLSGTQNWTDGIQLGNQPFTGEKFITIAVGEFYTGQMNALVLAGDDDANGTSNVTFKNIKIFETP